MDPITQGLLGGVAAQALLARKPAPRHLVWIAGVAGGLIPDADVVLQTIADPALPWELHRHFTHAYLMAPVMGLLAALPLLALRAFRQQARRTLLAAAVGALTHAPLDLCTSYGTKVYWPFSLHNATLDLFPIVDPLFSLVLLVGLVVAVRRHSRGGAVAACLFVALYTGAAMHQRSRALDAQDALLAARGEQPTRRRVIPLPGSLLAWRSLYEVEGHLVADVLRVSPLSPDRWAPGGRIPRIAEADVLIHVRNPRDTKRVRDVWRRYAVFADHWTARSPDAPEHLGDMRFSLGPGFAPIWSLALSSRDGEPPIRWVPTPTEARAVGPLWDLITGQSNALQSLDAHQQE